MGSLQFRVAEPADAPAVLAVKRAAIRDVAGWHYAAEQVEAWAPDEDALPAFETAIESDQFTVLLAERDGGTAGYGVLNGPAGRIDAVFVDPEHSGSGIATSLVRQLETRARMRGVETLTLVASRNARTFYESLDYAVVGTTTRTIDGVAVEFVEMEKRLAADGTEL